MSRKWEHEHPERHRELTRVRVQKMRAKRVVEAGDNRYYVYELAMGFPDPLHPLHVLHGSVFYVGKGVGDRIDAHERETRARLIGKQKRRRWGMSELSHKNKVILWLWDNGGEVLKNKVRTHMTEDVAYAYEAERIDLYGIEYLANEALPRKPKAKTPLPV